MRRVRGFGDAPESGLRAAAAGVVGAKVLRMGYAWQK